MLELWKPYLKLKDKNNPVIFTEFEDKFSEEASKRGVKFNISDEHPFVIFYDDKEDCYYYLKARSKFNNDGSIRDMISNVEVEILGEVEGLFQWDSYVDCSQIFKCNRELLESLLDINNEIVLKTTNLDNIDIENILDVLKENIMQVPPNISLIEVKLDDDMNTFGESLYLSKQKINKVDEYCNFRGISLPLEDIKKIRSLESNENSKYPRNRNRYQTGINFCLMFLNEYFPDEVNEFKNIQELNNNTQNTGGQK